MTERRKILITTAIWQSALACVQSYGRSGHDVYLFDSYPKAALGASRYCKGVIPAPSEEVPEAYRDALLATLREGSFDLLVPLSDAVIDIVALCQDDVRKYANIAISSAELIACARDKAASCRLGQKLGVPTPDTFYPETMEEVRALSASIDYPCVAKLPRGTGGDGVKVCENADELLAYFRSAAERQSWPFVQRFVEGDLYDIVAVCNRGQLVASFSFYLPLVYQVGGTPPYAFSCHSEAMIDIISRFARALDWHGALDIDLLKGDDGQFYLLELNPQFSGTITFAHKLGIDLPRAYADVALGNVTSGYQKDYQDDILFRSVVPVELRWLRSAPIRRGAIAIKNLFSHKNINNIYWDDRDLLWRYFKGAWM